jgi:uncharacterized protein YjiS (DUF1127 family)
MPNVAPYRVPGNAHVGGAGVVVSARGVRKTTLPFASTSTRSRTHVHILTFAFDAAFRLYVSFRKRRDRRRTLRALPNLDDRLLRDIGVTRGETAPWWFSDKNRHALAMLDDTELMHLSELGRKARRQARHGGSDESQR